MKNKLNALANLYELIQSAEKELGLKDLTEKDRLVLQVIINNIDENNTVKIKYKTIQKKLVITENNISRAQFFKSLSTLINKKIISRIGLERSSHFKFQSLKIINH